METAPDAGVCGLGATEFPSRSAVTNLVEPSEQYTGRTVPRALGPALFLKDDDDVFAHEHQIRELGCWALIYSSWDYGFAKKG